MGTQFDIRQSISRDTLDQIAAHETNKQCDDLIRSIDSELTSPLRLQQAYPASLVLHIGAASVTNPETGRVRTIAPINGVIPSFSGGTVTFDSTGAGNATPSVGSAIALGMSASQFLKISINVDSSGNIVLAKGAPGASAAAATMPANVSGTQSAGFYIVRTDGSNNVENVTNAYIYQYGAESGGGGSGGTGELNYVRNPNDSGNWTAVGDLALSTSMTASELPRENTTGTGIKIVADADTQSTADYVYTDFTLDDVDLNRVLKCVFSVKKLANYDGKLEALITTQADRTVAIAGCVITNIPGSDGEFYLPFTSDSTAALSLVIRADADMPTGDGICISNVIVGPGSVVEGLAGGDVAAVTMTTALTGTGTVVAKMRRVGDVAEFFVNIPVTGALGGTSTLSLPAGMTIDTSKIASTVVQPLGTAQFQDSGTATFPGFVSYSSSTSVLITAPRQGQGTSSGYVDRVVLSASVPFTWANNDNISLHFSVPIAEWSSGVYLAKRERGFVGASAHRNGTDQTGLNPNSSTIQVLLNSVAASGVFGWNVGGGYSTSGSGFTVPAGFGGKYRINTSVYVNSTNVLASTYALRLYRGATWGTSLLVAELDRRSPPASTGFQLIGSTEVNLAAGDTLYLGIFGSGNNSINTLSVAGGVTDTNWQISRVADENNEPVVGFGLATSTQAGLVSAEESGSFTSTYSGAIATPQNGTTYYHRVGKRVTLQFSGTSDAATAGTNSVMSVNFDGTTLPTRLRPGSDVLGATPCKVAGTWLSPSWKMTSAGAMTIYGNVQEGTGWGSSGNSLVRPFTITYLIP